MASQAPNILSRFTSPRRGKGDLLDHGGGSCYLRARNPQCGAGDTGEDLSTRPAVPWGSDPKDGLGGGKTSPQFVAPEQSAQFHLAKETARESGLSVAGVTEQPTSGLGTSRDLQSRTPRGQAGGERERGGALRPAPRSRPEGLRGLL